MAALTVDWKAATMVHHLADWMADLKVLAMVEWKAGPSVAWSAESRAVGMVSQTAVYWVVSWEHN